MHDPMTEKLSAFIDGGLSANEHAAVQAHIETCDVCRATLDELRDVVIAAAALRPTEPGADLWPGIAARIEAGAGDVVEHRFARRRFNLSLPQLAAAAVVLMTLSGGVVWMLDRDGAGDGVAGTIVHAAGSADAAGSTRLVDAAVPQDPAYDRDVADLERALEENRGSLDPATVDVIERSIESIDAAISDARKALASDPGNPHLHRQLDSTMRRKLDVLRLATRASS